MTDSTSSRTRTENRARILSAAAKLFDRYGPVKTTMSDIAREAEMSPANLYNFFKSRDDVVETVGEMHLAALRHRLSRGLAGKATAWDGICYIFLETAQNVRAHLANETDLLHLQLLERQNGWQFVLQFYEFIREQLETLLRRGTASGEFGDLDPAETASVLFDCMIAAVDVVLILKVDQAQHRRKIKAQLEFLRKALA